MSVLVTLLVVVLVVAYIRINQRQRQRWLTTLDLPGRWLIQSEGDGYLELAGELDGGSYRLTDQGRTVEGRWRYRGGNLELIDSEGTETRLSLNFFRAGIIGLTATEGQSKLYHKETSNVVPLGKN
ncbi:MAG TPA: hypothetical protein DCP57_04755 [Gammaproteobacteria bacterium]|jgi:hypothetical protein|nr:MAG: hypothetical protein CBC94_006075 [Gammaproteobacteria bacterium TMED134]RZO72784.1 MAG: hypothetical protein EVA67_00960 [OM182 bacterium]HAL41735.1 hypothetical protein [Gammaproteobacteria bacterium]HBK17270.1 hypothetical protein [Gammaproteobacteria bacterium]|tara:strand:- start:7638 stop:8015 length:378 start_codon:yes stop_codon:yes gene_type:complete